MSTIERNKKKSDTCPGTILSGVYRAVTRSYELLCATPSVWGNPTEIRVSGNAGV
jgi:hypothetical protein